MGGVLEHIISTKVCDKLLICLQKKKSVEERCYQETGLVHWEDPEESGGEGGGRGDRDGEYM